MINTKHLSKVTSAWISIVYAICYVGVAIYPPIRTLFMRFSLHSEIAIKSEFIGLGYFISGLIIWNVVALLAVWLFAVLFNKLK